MVRKNKSYREVSRVILQKIVENDIDIKERGYQNYFHDLKAKEPDKYGGLIFDCNGNLPFSKYLGFIFMDFKIVGFMNFDNSVSEKQKEGIRKYLDLE